MSFFLKPLRAKPQTHSLPRTRSRRVSVLVLESLEERLAPAATYYLSPLGDDARDGLSPQNAWRTIARVNALTPLPGDTLRFQGGGRFDGALKIFQGDPTAPITVTTYGVGRATIASGAARGLWSCSPGGLVVENLNFVGAGVDANEVSGIELCNFGNFTGPASRFRIQDVDVQGYGIAGLTVLSDAAYGISDIRIARAVVHHNANGMIIGHGGNPALRVISNLYLSQVEAHHNDKANVSIAGVGVNLNNVRGGVVERSLFHDNGLFSRSPGHAGLLVNDSSNLVVQHNEAYRNLDPAGMDGQGIVFSQVTDSVIQYNYVHDNGNGGLELTTDGAVYPTQRVTLRYNVSENDAAGLVVFFGVQDAEIYNNTIHSGPAPSSGFRVGAVVGGPWSGARVHFRNNIFEAAAGTAMLIVEDGAYAASHDLRFQNNAYHALSDSTATSIIFGQVGYDSLDDWRRLTGQEALDGQPTGYLGDPRLANSGSGGTIGDPERLASLSAYQLRPDSPLAAAGLDLGRRFHIDVGARDYYGTPLTAGSFAIGAAQPVLSPPSPGLTPHQRFVHRAYLDLLDRPADSAGLAAWTELLDSGSSRAQLVRGLVHSVEYRELLVRGLYQKYLRREPDAPGLRLFVNFLAEGGTVPAVTAAIVGSPEYLTNAGGGTNAGFLAALYLGALGRRMDPAGQGHFEKLLTTGTPRSQVATLLLASDEYSRLLVSGAYSRFLGRTADAGGLNAFVELLRSGGQVEEVIVAACSSAEYFARL